MHRRNLLKALSISPFAPSLLLAGQAAGATAYTTKDYASGWEQLPDMSWTGAELWAQRLQDWNILDGSLVCNLRAPNRTVHLLTHQLSGRHLPFQTSAIIRFKPGLVQKKGHFAGFKIGVKGIIKDYRSAVITGKGLHCGIHTDGSIFFGQSVAQAIPQQELHSGVRLALNAVPAGRDYSITLTAHSAGTGSPLTTLKAEHIPADSLSGNIALISHFDGEDAEDEGWVTGFREWKASGDKLDYDASHTFGPIYFAQYTLHRNVLKLSAQLAPVNLSLNNKAILEVKRNGQWQAVAQAAIHPLARVAAFRVENWKENTTVPYRVKYEAYSYEGSIAAEPLNRDDVKALVFSCNGDFGFPDNDVVKHAAAHKADLILFLGDQFYERNGDFRTQTAPLNKAALDVLRKWVQFGWSYRELFRHIPSVCLPDDHDVFHGNLWGSSGKAADITGNKSRSQDTGGYLMPPEWVNLIQLCQTSHMPDPYDPSPVLQGISVYYTHWQYAGISFGIIEDRKFKSAPRNVLPDEAEVFNGYAQNTAFDITKWTEPATISLLGERQMAFLDEWTQDWSNHTQFKVLLSATPFMCLQTLPEGSLNDQVTGSLTIPEPGIYVAGDKPTRDMDTDGWPHHRRDEVVALLRKGFAFHLAGDQHIASLVQYGTAAHEDSGYVFTTPALGNVFPRRWWPPVDKDHQHLPGQPAYTGNFEDGFGNRITVHAVANPVKTGLEPAVVYDRATGYGVATFHKKSREITVECWPRQADPHLQPKGQYTGWPRTIRQLDNYSRKALGHLPALHVNGLSNPVIQLVHEGTRQVEYTLRIRGQQFRPHVFEEGSYTVIISGPDEGKEKVLKGLTIRQTAEPLIVNL
ncbi:alkaline phosphatase D family protein [Chitinophaga sp.]|uniref:alkaline phosphatase D family protein n=1 Tax=Chitinophaga sp. TaxID=1869181 RepID=UPI0031CEA409